MNIELTNKIAQHILSGLCVLDADYVNHKDCRSLTDEQYLLPEKMSFAIDEDLINNNVYGCQMTFGGKIFKMILADCSTEKNCQEYCLFSQLQDAPAYGIFFDTQEKENTLIAVNSTKKFWMPCTIFLQATFLAGMEQIKDIAYGWNQCTKYSEEYKQLQSFISFHDEYCNETDIEEEDYEGQKV